MMYKTTHELAGKTVLLNSKTPELNNCEFVVEDWWENISGKSWMFCNGNTACLQYAVRSAECDLPTDDNVVYGKIGSSGYLIHTSELGGIIENG